MIRESPGRLRNKLEETCNVLPLVQRFGFGEHCRPGEVSKPENSESARSVMFHTAPIEVFFIPSRPARAPAEYGRMLLTGCSGPFDRLRVSDPGFTSLPRCAWKAA